MKDSGYKWIGQIPDDWKVERLKGHFTFGKGLPITKADLIEEGAPVISYGQIHSKANTGVKLDDSLERFVSKDFINSNPQSLVEEGDFIFADTSEDVEGCGACVYVDKQKELFAGYHTIIARSNNKQNNKYFAYLFLTDNWRSQIREKVDGVKLFSTTQTILKQTYILLPPQDQQKKIADFLDTKCSELQSAIDNTKQTIEEYKKLKQAVITKAVTKGLEPNRKMKDSGIEWIGEIPEDWEIRKLKNLFQFLGGYAFKSDDYVSETDYQIIRMGNVKDFKILFDSSPAYISEDLALSVNNYKLKPDWILFTMTGTRGKKDYFYTCKITEEDCNYKNLYLNQRVGCLIPNENIFSSYFNYLLKVDLIKETVFLLETGTANQANIGSEDVMKLKVHCPPLSEQKAIAEYLDRKCSQIDTLISQKEQFITELEKYKQSLIYEYVTGKRVLN